MLAWSLVDIFSRNWALVTFALTAAALGLVGATVIGKYVRIALNIMRTTKPPLARNPLDFERVAGEAVEFHAFDGMRLAGMMIRAAADAPHRGTLIFAHEFCSDMHSCARYCRPLLEIGYDVFTFDFRGHGQSACDPDYEPRQWVTDRELYDMRGAIATVERFLDRSGRPRDIALVGVSRGACAAILAAAENPNVRALICDGAFSTDCTVEYFMKRWASIFATVRVVYENHHPAFWRFLRWCMLRRASREFRCTFPSVRKAIQRMTPRPILFIHGEKDSYLPVEQSRLLYALAPQPKSFWVAAGARHNQAVARHPELYARITAEFLNRHLGRAAEEPRPPRPSLAWPGDAIDPAEPTVTGGPALLRPPRLSSSGGLAPPTSE